MAAVLRTMLLAAVLGLVLVVPAQADVSGTRARRTPCSTSGPTSRAPTPAACRG